MANNKPETYEQQVAATKRANERRRKREAAWAKARAKVLAKVSRFQKQRQFIEIRTEGLTLIVTTGTVGKTSATQKTRLRDEKALERAVKHARAGAILAHFRKVRSFK